MKQRLIPLALALILCGCMPEMPPVETTAAPVETTAVPETVAVPETTVAPETTAAPVETTAAPVETTVPAVPETTADPFPMPSPGDGVLHVASAAELTGADLAAVTTLCVTSPFALEVALTLDHPITLYYSPETVSPGAVGITLATRAEGRIAVVTRCADLLACGWLTVDAPYAALTWSGPLPIADDVAHFCNVASYNGERAYATLGGKGDVQLSGVSFGRYACDVAIRGNVITLGYPLVVPMGEATAATLAFAGQGSAPARTYDLTRPCRVTLTDAAGLSRTYLLEAERLTYALPILALTTADAAPIESKTEYVAGTLTLEGETHAMRIRGRGNASWSAFPKKSYRIKLDAGASLFGLAQNRDWVLTSNYADKSLIRNLVAHDIAASLDGMAFTPTHISVNLYLNGAYMGVYTFADKIEEGAGRIDFTDDPADEPNTYGGLDIGFLCEVGWDFDGENVYNKDYFDAKKVVRIYVKEPEAERANTPEFTYARQYILAMEAALAAGEGWQGYIDLDSWVDWFIATELTFNTESAFYRSCYFWKPAGGKLQLGPVWDFDMAFGNHYGDLAGYDGWCTTESTYVYISDNWMNDLIKTPEFQSALRARWNAVKADLLATALESVDRHAADLAGSAEQNFAVWNILPYQIGAGSVNAARYPTHAAQVQYVREFIETRWAYMDARINGGE